MNISNSIRSIFMVFGLVLVATAAANAQQQRFAPPPVSSQHARLGIETTFQQVGIKNGVVANFGERVNRVRPGSPAAQTGLEAGDTIVGYYMGNSYRKIHRKADLKFAIVASRGDLRVRLINYRNGRYHNAKIHFHMGSGQGGHGQGGHGTGGPVVYDERDFTKIFPFPTTPPPAPKYQTPRARAGYVWIPGNHRWNKKSGSYHWVRGHWETARANRAAWTTGYWSKQGHRWVWTAGRWTKVGPTVRVTRR